MIADSSQVDDEKSGNFVFLKAYANIFWSKSERNKKENEDSWKSWIFLQISKDDDVHAWLTCKHKLSDESKVELNFSVSLFARRNRKKWLNVYRIPTRKR